MDKHNVRKGELVVFADEQERLVKPLTIRQLRDFVKIIEKMDQEKFGTAMNDEDIDTMMDAASIILKKVDPELAADRERLEDSIDLDVFAKLMNIAMGQSSPEE